MRLQLHAVTVAIAALVSVTMPASGQRGMRGGSRSGGGRYPQGGGEAAVIARVAPPIVGLVLEHADEFSLSDTQRSALEAVRQAQDSANRPWMLKLDSLRPRGMPANGMGDLSQEQRDEIEARKVAVAKVIEGMRETNAEARKKVMDILNPDQQQRAAVLEDEAKKQLDEASKRNARGEGGGGRGGRGRPPED